MIEIAFASDAAHFSQEHLLFGRHYIVEFQWIERQGDWVMHLYDGVEKPIALGLRITPYWPIYVDKTHKISFILLAKSPNTKLSRRSLYEDFVLVVHAL